MHGLPSLLGLCEKVDFSKNQFCKLSILFDRIFIIFRSHTVWLDAKLGKSYFLTMGECSSEELLDINSAGSNRIFSKPIRLAMMR